MEARGVAPLSEDNDNTSFYGHSEEGHRLSFFQIDGEYAPHFGL